MGRRGVVLPAAIVVLVILLLLAGSRRLVSHHQLDAVVRLADHERAYQIAASAVRVATQQIDRLATFVNDPDPATLPKRTKAPEELRPLVDGVLDSSGAFRSGVEIALDSGLLRRSVPENASNGAAGEKAKGSPPSPAGKRAISSRARRSQMEIPLSPYSPTATHLPSGDTLSAATSLESWHRVNRASL